MKRYACCYCRYSSDNQQQQSIDYQLEQIKKFAVQHNIEIVSEYIDEARTGTSDIREQFQKMIEDSKQSKWGYVLVYNTSRLTRNVEDQMFYQKILKQRGVMVVSVEEKFDSSPEGHLFSLITAGINEYYSKHLAKRSFAGVMQNAKKCLATGGIPPLGYDVDKNKRYVINSKEAESVRIIFQKYCEGWSFVRISNYLNEKGYRTKRGKPFVPNLHDLIQNRKYTGEFTFNKSTRAKSRGPRNARANIEDEVIRVPGGIPAIIDKAIFEKVQRTLKKNRGNKRFGYKMSKYFLTGLMKCGTCNHAFYGGSSFGKAKNNPTVYYGHTYYRRSQCKTKEIPTLYLDNWIKKVVLPVFLANQDISERVISKNQTVIKQKEEQKAKLKLIKEQIKMVDIEVKGQASKVVSGGFAMFVVEELNELKEKFYKLQLSQLKLEKEIKKLRNITAIQLRQFINEKRQKWENANGLSEQRSILHDIISKIVITNEVIRVYASYESITKEHVDLDFEIAHIEREVLMKMWRKPKLK